MAKALCVGVLICAAWYGFIATIVADDYAMQKCQQTSTYSTCRSILR